MITLEGKTHIKRYLAGFVPSIAQSIAFGLGDKAESVNDRALQFEIARADILLTSYDFITNKLIFKAALPEEYTGVIYEAALFSQPTNTLAGEAGSRLIATFDSGSESWLTGGGLPTFTTANTRIGGDSLLQSPAASGTATSSWGELGLNFSENSGADTFTFAVNAGANVSNVTVRFLTDGANYYTFTTGALTPGYKVVPAPMSTAVATGTPSWGNITEIQVSTTATSGGAAAVNFDGIRIEDVDTINPDYVMVSRELLAAPFTKQEGRIQEVEFTLDVSV